jgi:hypothetical protein
MNEGLFIERYFSVPHMKHFYNNVWNEDQKSRIRLLVQEATGSGLDIFPVGNPNRPGYHMQLRIGSKEPGDINGHVVALLRIRDTQKFRWQGNNNWEPLSAEHIGVFAEGVQSVLAMTSHTDWTYNPKGRHANEYINGHENDL